MIDITRAAALVLAVVFAWSAGAKLRDPSATARSFRGLGIPGAGVAARGVACVELALALALLFRPAATGWPALVLLAMFTAVIVRALSRGLSVPCACFGAANDRPVSVVEVMRNGGLAALAILVTGAGPKSATEVSLPALVIVSVVVALGRVALAVVELRLDGGHVFATPLPGEQRR